MQNVHLTNKFHPLFGWGQVKERNKLHSSSVLRCPNETREKRNKKTSKWRTGNAKLENIVNKYISFFKSNQIIKPKVEKNYK